jgi:hypothetical protein
MAYVGNVDVLLPCATVLEELMVMMARDDEVDERGGKGISICGISCSFLHQSTNLYDNFSIKIPSHNISYNPSNGTNNILLDRAEEQCLRAVIHLYYPKAVSKRTTRVCGQMPALDPRSSTFQRRTHWCWQHNE